MVNVVIVGSGLAGTIAAKTLRELDPEARIVILGEERHPYYPRPNLVEFLAGRLAEGKLYAFPESWVDRQRIELRPGDGVARILPAERKVETASGVSHAYDVLLLATGARAALPPVAGSGRRGVFVLRTLDDARAILDHLRDHGRVAVLGGGLLGLEIARAVRGRVAEVHVVEFFDRLLPRQLDPAAAAILKAQIERTGISIRLGAAAREIFGDGEVRGLKFESGDVIEADAVIVAAGVKPECGPARDAGVAVGKGILVDDLMRTSVPGIYAAGDAAEHRGRVYGIIPAAFEQARAAAHNILGRELPYAGTVPSNTLKVAGLFVTSAGDFDGRGPGFESLVRAVPEEGLYKKIVLRDGRVVGAIWMGTKKGAPEISRLVALNKDVRGRGEELFEESFDFAEIP
jgi:nitrite reductase (NADH) large subunit